LSNAATLVSAMQERKVKAMNDTKDSTDAVRLAILWSAAAGAALIAAAAITVSPRPAQALPAYAAQTKLPCAR
jgi:hypothetical protein